MIVRRVLNTIIKFFLSMVLMTFVCAFVWEKFVDGSIYDNRDSIGLGYLSTDDWNGSDPWPVVVVKNVVSDRAMSEPDEIKEGWSVASLAGLWFLFFGTSLGLSLLLVRMRWRALIKSAFFRAGST
jgi:hypothetical protein